MLEKPTYEELEHRIKDLEEAGGESVKRWHLAEEKILHEKLLSEEKYRQLFDTVSDAIMLFDAETMEFIDVNRAAIKLYGYNEKEFLKLKQPDITGEPRESEKTIKQTLSGELTAIPLRYHKKKDGTLFPVEISTGKFKIGDRQILCGVIRDITERKEAEEERLKLEGQLQQGQKMESIGRLAGGVAHDYNNALTAIIGYTELAMTDAYTNGLLHDNLNEILKASTHAKDITRQLLAFASKETIAPQVIDLNTNIDVMLKMLQSLIGEDIDLVWYPGKNLWPVKMDPSQIDQILLNLCVNAKDAIAGVGKITIETDMVALDEAYCSYHTDFIPGGFVMIVISDNGCGMEKEILDNIFEPFFTTKDIEEGTGLGLSTVYGIVKQNNGFINLYSEPDIGTTITIYLPRDGSEIAEIHGEGTDEISLGGVETILVVEDEISILKLAKKILNGFGYKVLAANSPKGALMMAKEYKNKIDLILTDVIMPEMYGDELINSLQPLYPDLKHIFMSGYTAKSIARHGVLDEGVAFIQKPFSQIDLAKIVRKVLDE